MSATKPTYTVTITDGATGTCVETVFEISADDTAAYIGQQVLEAIRRYEGSYA